MDAGIHETSATNGDGEWQGTLIPLGGTAVDLEEAILASSAKPSVLNRLLAAAARVQHEETDNAQVSLRSTFPPLPYIFSQSNILPLPAHIPMHTNKLSNIKMKINQNHHRIKQNQAYLTGI